MNDIIQDVNINHVLMGVFGLILLLQIRQYAINRSRFFKTWGAFAQSTGLESTDTSLRSPFGKVGPEIAGDYHGKEVRVSASYLGVFGRRQALLNFNLLVDNPSTDKLPAGAFLVVRRNPQAFGVWHRLRVFFMGEKEKTANLQDQYHIHGVPKNLGNFIFRQESTGNLIQLPGMLDLHINRQDLSYSFLGYINDRGYLQQILDDLRDLAVVFEHFVKNWL